MNLNASNSFFPIAASLAGRESVILWSVRVSSDTFAHKSVETRPQCFRCLVWKISHWLWISWKRDLWTRRQVAVCRARCTLPRRPQVRMPQAKPRPLLGSSRREGRQIQLNSVARQWASTTLPCGCGSSEVLHRRLQWKGGNIHLPVLNTVRHVYVTREVPVDENLPLDRQEASWMTVPTV